MTPPAPSYRASWFDRRVVVRHVRAPALRMIIRSVTRRPVRAMLTAAGMSLAIAIVVFGGFTADALARVVDVRFQHEERQDLSVVLRHARSLGQWSGIDELPGIRLAEPYRCRPGPPACWGRRSGCHVDWSRSPFTTSEAHGHELRDDGDPARRRGHRILVGDPTPRSPRRNGGARDPRRPTSHRHDTRGWIIDEPLGRYVYGDLGTVGRLLDEPNTFSAVNVLVDLRARAISIRR